MTFHDTTLWTTRDGRQVAISDMETRHLVNAIAKIKRSTSTPKWRIKYLDRLEMELERRQDVERLSGRGPYNFAGDSPPDMEVLDGPMTYRNTRYNFRGDSPAIDDGNDIEEF